MGMGTNIQAINYNNNIQPKFQMNFRAQTIPVQDYPPDTVEINGKVKAGMSNGTKAAIGAGVVTALAVCADFLFCKGKHAKSIFRKAGNKSGNIERSTNDVKLKELQKQAEELKAKICGEYQKKLSERFSIEDYSSLVLQDGFKYGGKTKITCAKDYDKAKDYIIHLHENSGPGRDFYIPAKQLKNNLFNDLKSKLQELQKDSDWVELRKIRKNLLKQKKNITKENRPVIEGHINLIDDILLSKVSKDSSTVTLFEEFWGMSLKDASELAKKSSKEVFDNVDYHSKYEPFPDAITMHLRQLKLSDFFKREVREWELANKTIKDTESALAFLDNQKQKFQKYQKTLAQEIRQSDDVKALKELNRKIAELSKQNSQ